MEIGRGHVFVSFYVEGKFLYIWMIVCILVCGVKA